MTRIKTRMTVDEGILQRKYGHSFFGNQEDKWKADDE